MSGKAALELDRVRFEKAALERQIAELRAERDTLAMHLEAKTILADRDRLSAELSEARAEIERMTPLAVAYDYLEPPVGREMAEAKLEEIAGICDYATGSATLNMIRDMARSFLASKEASQ